MEFALTVKKTRKPVTEQHYYDYLNYLSDYVTDIGNVRFEKTRGLHIHCIIKTDKYFDFKLLKPEKFGWNAMAVPIYNRAGWIRYARKDEKENGIPEHEYKDDLIDDDIQEHIENPLPTKKLFS